MSEVSQTGRTPPHSPDAEQAVLGAMLYDNKQIDIVLDLLKSANVFYSQHHRDIFQAIVDLRSYSMQADIVTVTNELEKRGKLEAVGGRAYLADIASGTASASNVRRHAEILIEKYNYRNIIEFSSDMVNSAFKQDSPPEVIIDGAITNLFDVAANTARKGFVNVGQGGIELLESMQQPIGDGDRRSMGIPTPFKELNRLVAGLTPGLTIIAARPSAGKSALMDNIGQFTASNGYKTCVKSMEMSKEQYLLRAMCSRAEMDSMKARRGELNDDEMSRLAKAQVELEAMPYYIDDSSDYNINSIVSSAMAARNAGKLDILMIDYLQYIRHSNQRMDRRFQISAFTQILKRLSRELDIPVVVLSQLSRKLEERRSKRPMLSDLKESGDIEQDADLVLFIYRPIMYATKKELEQGRFQVEAELIIAKQRNGPTGKVNLKFREKYTRFEDIEPLPQLGLGQEPF